MPYLIKFLGFYALVGFAIALAFVLVVFGIDLGGLWSLLVKSNVKWLGAFMFLAFNTITFSSIAMGIAIMTLPYDDDGKGKGRRLRRRALFGSASIKPPETDAQPIPVRAGDS
ncbi:MAG: hypothetical protein CMK07_05780 [Ponticaulis sp.]|nr:hypothetical protein [Ponticaulis sp.]